MSRKMYNFEESHPTRNEVAGDRMAQIVDALCSEFDVELERCKADTVEFLELLVKRQLMVFA